MATSITGEARVPLVDLMRHLEAWGGPLGVGQKRQDDAAEAGGKFNQVLT